MFNKDYQVFGKFNSLRNTLTNSRSNMSITCLRFTLMKPPFITARKIAGIYWVISSCFNSVSIFMLVSYDYSTETMNQLAQIQTIR